MRLFVGLGNPGDRYRGNRHNIGFMAVERIAERYGFSPWRKKFSGLICEGTIGPQRIVLLKPETYMNESGRSVGEASRFLKIEPADVVVFHDELDLAPGKLKAKTGGGNAGHNGLRSITANIGNDYPRIRLGIGHPGSKEAVSPYVLSDFAKSERDWLDQLLDAVAESAEPLARGDAVRFLSDAARRLGTEPADPAVQGKAQRDARTGPPVAPRSPPHPAGERGNKRQSALAENLKKWLGARKSPNIGPGNDGD